MVLHGSGPSRRMPVGRRGNWFCRDGLWQVDYCLEVHAVKSIWHRLLPNHALSAVLMLPPTHTVTNTCYLLLLVAPLSFSLVHFQMLVSKNFSVNKSKADLFR